MHLRRMCVAAGLVVALFSRQAAFAQEDAIRASGAKISNLTFKDAAGKTIALQDWHDKKMIVVAFLSFDCPVSNSYASVLADMHTEYGKHGVAFLGLTTNPDESADDVAKHAREFKIPFPVVKDVNFIAADALAAQVTPEVFVLDGGFVLRYRGRIDDAYYARLKHKQVTERNLHQVVGELLSGRPVSIQATEAVGCSIPRPVKEFSKRTDVTFYRDVLPILQNRCQSCHRPGEVGPFSLLNYRQAVNWAEDIKTFTHNGQMPPWKPVVSEPFLNDRRISKKEIETLAAWVDGGTPAGDPQQTPAREFPRGWQLGTPDLVLQMPEQFTLGPTGSDVFRCYVLPTGLTEDKHVVAIEVRPGNPSIVHHTLQFIDTTGQGRKLEQQAQNKKPAADGHEPTLDKGPGYSVAMGIGFAPQGGLAGWAPGQMPRYLPDGMGYLLPKNSDVILQTHYHRNGKVAHDQTMVGLYFAKKPIKHTYRGDMLAGGGVGPLFAFFSIPPNEERHKVEGDKWATGDFTLYSIMPHMHLLGKDIKVTMTPPGEAETTLIHINEWDYNWQETYWFKDPIVVKAGTRFHIEAYYDNSSKNPNNPYNPPRRVLFGEQTTNEMCFVFLGGISDGRGRRLPTSWTAPETKK